MVQVASYPVILQLAGQRCVVIGGGRVAARKIIGLLEAGAEVAVISPQLDEALVKLATKGRIQVQQEVYQAGMLAALKPLLVFATTDSSAVNRQVVDEAQALKFMVNAADDATNSDFTNMATIQRGIITIGISTGGASPALSTHLKTQIESVVGEEYTQLAHWLAELRPLAIGQLATHADREAFWHRVINSSILEHLQQGDKGRARAELDRLWAEARQNL